VLGRRARGARRWWWCRGRVGSTRARAGGEGCEEAARDEGRAVDVVPEGREWTQRAVWGAKGMGALGGTEGCTPLAGRALGAAALVAGGERSWGGRGTRGCGMCGGLGRWERVGMVRDQVILGEFATRVVGGKVPWPLWGGTRRGVTLGSRMGVQTRAWGAGWA